MKRIITPALAASLLALTACSGGGSANPSKLVPDDADFIGGINMKALAGSKLYTDNKEKLTKEEDYKKVIEAAKECGIDVEKLDSVIFGADSKEHVVIVVSGAGVGKKSNLECVAAKAKEDTGKEEMTFGDRNGKSVIELEDDAVGYMINDNLLAVAHKDWADQVAELIDGKGKPAVDNKLKDVYGRAPTGQHIWVAGIVPSDMGSKLGPADAAKDMTAGLDFSDGLGIEATAGFADADTAKSTTEKLQSEFDKVKGLAGMVGVPSTVVESVKMEADGAAMKVSVKATNDDLEKIQKGIEEAMGGGLGGPPPTGE